MKIKKFNNLWTMGLIILGVILVGLYLTKLIFPEFVVRVAEIDSIVKFGTYVDTHKWAYYLFNSVVSFFVLYFYCCACCRISKLNYKETLVILASCILCLVIERYLPSFLFVYNNTAYVFLPLIISVLEKIKDINILYSTTTCFLLTSFAQVISLYVRDIGMMISCYNTATYFVLLIDAYIWNVLVYLYYNYKRRD